MLLLLFVKLLGHRKEARILGLDVVPGRELILLSIGCGERVLAEQVTEFDDRIVHTRFRGAAADEDEILCREHENLSLELLHQLFEGIGGNADMVLAPVLRF